MELTTGDMKQSRLRNLAKGVKAAAWTIDNKFLAELGEPRLNRKGDAFLPSSPYRTALITLTYREDGMWAPGHISALIKHYREWFRRHGLGWAFHCVWVMEFTQLGRPHYHLVAWFPRGVKPPLPDKQGWWPHGDTQAVYARSPVGYITKYASKSTSKSAAHLPKKARLWGYAGLSMEERADIAFAKCPRWLKGLVHPDSHPVKRTVEVTRYCKGSGNKIVEKCSAWVLLAGMAMGWAFFGPYEYDGFTGNGIALRHKGFVEVMTPDGDAWVLNHEGKI
ncbi:rolling circle replication-associated protein [Pseudoxanthomonas winnipegensis]|uniref:Adhesin n=1 Tax=Pseudoxanthomonas winnipegensis TaxID=2480810 RepID=A0A4Q8M9D5_9GAMM|nr:adhesin [Pseudoxanthomonas winnipegensis]PZP59148.1 MAG: adhesin [Pseudoxanthomonas spadix]TAA46284.1 adhesin [Pseudoxanthomonas winnipegensis]